MTFYYLCLDFLSSSFFIFFIFFLESNKIGPAVNVTDGKIMKNAQIIGLITAITNVLPGLLLVWLHKPIGSCASAFGKKMRLDKLLHRKLYEEKNSQKFILVVGIWLIVWGVLAYFLLTALT